MTDSKAPPALPSNQQTSNLGVCPDCGGPFNGEFMHKPEHCISRLRAELNALRQHHASKERTLLQSFVDMEDISTYADPKKFWAAYAVITQKARALLSGEPPAVETGTDEHGFHHHDFKRTPGIAPLSGNDMHQCDCGERIYSVPVRRETSK